ncbi:hypothetical protein [Leucobacter tenebrionis]|uniref:hypothetical protein n=1 Tax=Leucobacter tenebrionis TaxID=2873270 RepID=UPI001CA71A24|nr:hypothetical protein [Leucobacter tenebrionis]QZY53121.1 hypothetical protein KVY00_06780 [Leucobacter tenebrionis]
MEAPDNPSVSSSVEPFYGSLEQLAPHHVYDDATTQAIVHQRDVLQRNIATVLIAEAAERQGARLKWIDENYVIAERDNKRLLLAGSRGRASRAAASLVTDKWLTKELLLRNHVSTARGILPQTLEDVLSFQQEINGPIVVKPRFGYGGKAVSVNLTEPSEIARAYEQARSQGDVVAEEYVQNVVEYRCVSSDTRCVSVVGRLLPWVLGDGVSTVRTLIQRKNEVRDTVPSTHKRHIPIDAETEACLANQSMTLDSVLPQGKTLIVRQVGGLTLGGEPFECSHLVDRSIQDFAVSAVKAIPGLNWAGVDVIITPSGDPYVVEINTSSDTLGSQFPWYGTRVSLADYMFEARIQAAPETQQTAPRFPALLASPRPLLSKQAIEAGRSYYLATLLRQRVPALGWKLDKKSDYIALATSPEGREVWLQGTSSTLDLNIARRAARIHGVVRALMELQAIPRPLSAEVRSISEVENFRGETQAPVSLVMPDQEWGGGKTVELEQGRPAQDLKMSGRHAWIAQMRPAGRRFLAIASPQEVLAVLGESSLTYSELALLSSLAVRTVRAVPELRWSAVDIVVLEQPTRFTQLVQGITVNPVITPSQKLLSGSLDDVLRFVLA